MNRTLLIVAGVAATGVVAYATWRMLAAQQEAAAKQSNRSPSQAPSASASVVDKQPRSAENPRNNQTQPSSSPLPERSEPSPATMIATSAPIHTVASEQAVEHQRQQQPAPTPPEHLEPAASQLSPPPSELTPATPLPPDWRHPELAPLVDFFSLFQLPRPQLTVVEPQELPPVYQHLLHHSRNMTPTLHAFWNAQQVKLAVVRKDERRKEGQLRRWIKLEVEKGEHLTIGEDGFPIPSPTASAAPAPAPVVDSSSSSADKPQNLTNAAMSAPSSVAVSSGCPPSASSASSSLPSTSPTPVEFGSIRIHVNNLPASLHESVWASVIPFHTLLATHAPPIVQTVTISIYFRMAWTDQIRAALHIDAAVIDSGARWVYGRCNTMRDTNGRVICEVVEVMPPMRRKDTSR
jgi:hypothetical protein